MKVEDLIRQLCALPAHLEVQCWLPGTYINLSSAFTRGGKVLIEGDVVEGSAIEDLAAAPPGAKRAKSQTRPTFREFFKQRNGFEIGNPPQKMLLDMYLLRLGNTLAAFVDREASTNG